MTTNPTPGQETTMIDNTAWLDGYAAYEAGESCPWDDSARAGWIAAKADGAVR